MTSKSVIRCAIYTRKSSEEGLEQEFNSLHAQREACEAFIKSQKHESWQLIKSTYDDGGFSGGSMQRPALTQLLADIADGKVDIIVVYKVDRLSRSLHDFARMVELFDKHKVSFVSVTQQFNTTSSMGRLTLNVLLSFAQFEREVTGERIRDKIAASKKKGIWMGGPVPIGYDVIERKLIINPEEAKIVRMIYERYLHYGCVRLVKEELDNSGITSKSRTRQDGTIAPGSPFTRGNLYQLLANPIYIGQIRHQGTCYPGQHEAIIDQTLWDDVQLHLALHAHEGGTGKRQKSSSLLAGKLFDESGERLTTSSAARNKLRYRYYISSVLSNGIKAQHQNGWRLPAQAIEQMVIEAALTILKDTGAIVTAVQEANIPVHHMPAILAAIEHSIIKLDNAEAIIKMVERVELKPNSITLRLSLASLLPADCTALAAPTVTQEIPMQMKRRGLEMRLVINQGNAAKPDLSLIKAIARANAWFAELSSGKTESITAIAKREKIDKGYVSHLLNLAFLSPEITEAIVTGHQPIDITVQKLIKRITLPYIWAEQQRVLGLC